MKSQPYLVHSVVPPLWRKPHWPDYTGMRLPWRYCVVLETIRPRGADGIRATGHDRVSVHWTRRAALAAAMAANRAGAT